MVSRERAGAWIRLLLAVAWCDAPVLHNRVRRHAAGFNIPGWVLEELRSGALGPLTVQVAHTAPVAEDVKVGWSQEECLLQLAPVGTQYVIGVCGEEGALRHELAVRSIRLLN